LKLPRSSEEVRLRKHCVNLQQRRRMRPWAPQWMGLRALLLIELDSIFGELLRVL